jgi:hypothetical protein
MSATGVTPKETTRRLLIADDYPQIRKMVRATLGQYPLFEVLGEVADGAQAVNEAKKLKPDVVVLNASMPVMNGFEAAREIKDSLPGTAIAGARNRSINCGREKLQGCGLVPRHHREDSEYASRQYFSKAGSS